MTSLSVPAELLDPVVAYFRPQRVILFGSTARGEAGPDSDFDLLVIVDDDAPAEKLTLQAGFEAHRSCAKPADVFPMRPPYSNGTEWSSAHSRRKPIPTGLSFTARRWSRRR